MRATMSRAVDAHLRYLERDGVTRDGERGKAYSVRLAAGSQSVEVKALAESKGVTIALADRPFNVRLRTANVLEVRGEGATLHVPLDRSAAALERLDACFEKNSRESTEINPFVAPSKRP
jgi:hypothetical protein